MNVRDLSIVLRPRSNWEAVDLGAALAKRYYRDLFRIGLLSFGPFFLVLALLCWKLPLLLPLLIFWVKPLMDRFYLFYLSRRIFGQEVTVRETLGEWKRLLLNGGFSLLTWRRISVSRSLILAVSDLENLTGSARGQRCSVVSRVGGGHAFLITLGGWLLELVGLATVLILGNMFIPQGQAVEWDVMVVWFGQGGVGQTVLMLLFGLSYGLLVLLLEPFYLAGGFALYLNSRTSQEAWDIELRFRELAARVAKTRLNTSDSNGEAEEFPPQVSTKPRFQFAGSNKELGMLVALGVLGLFGVSETQAGDRDPQVVVEDVLAHGDFTNHVEKYKKWVPAENSWLERWNDWLEQRQSKNPDEGDSLGNSGSGAAFNGVFQLVGILALVLLLAALLVLMIHLFKGRSLGDGAKKKGFKRPPPKVVMGMDVTPESLPDDLLAQARHYWNNGQTRLAMSLLYRGALTDLITRQEVTIEGSDTESECLAQVEAMAPRNLSGYFKLLSVQWMKAAYSREQVASDVFERLCQTWPFERRAG